MLFRSDRLIDEVLDALRAYEGNTDEFLSESRTTLVSLVRELIDRIPGTAPAAPDELPTEVETEIVAEVMSHARDLPERVSPDEPFATFRRRVTAMSEQWCGGHPPSRRHPAP